MGENTVAAEGRDEVSVRTGDASRRNSAVLVTFTAITNLADGVTKVALPLMTTSLTSSPALVSGVMLTLTLPWLLAALPVGVLVDRSDRRKLLWLANGMRIVVMLVLLGAVAAGWSSLPMIYVGGTVLGVAEVIALISAAALVPDAVAPAGRERVNAWVAGAETVCNEFAGPFVGGLLITAGALVALGATTAGYLVGIVVLFFLVGRFRVDTMADQPKRSMREQIVEGLQVLWYHRLLRMMALALTVLCACWGAWFGLIPLVGTKELGLSADRYGLLLGGVGVGGLIGTLIVRVSNRMIGRRWVMFGDIVFTLAMVAVPAVTSSVWAVGVAAFLGGMGGTLWNINARTIAQLLVSSEMMGRYMAAYRLFSWGAVPLGAGLAGLLAEWFGSRVSLAVFSVAAVAVIVPFLRASARTPIDGTPGLQLQAGEEPIR